MYEVLTAVLLKTEVLCWSNSVNWMSGSGPSPSLTGYNRIFKHFLVSWPKATTCSLQLQYGVWKTLSRNVERNIITLHRTVVHHFSYSNTFRTCTEHQGHCMFRTWKGLSKNDKHIGNRLLYLQELHRRLRNFITYHTLVQNC